MSFWIEAERGELPTGPGCYVVYLDGEVVYVGSTTRLEHRCRSYRRKGRRHKRRSGLWRSPWGYIAHDAIRIKAKCSRRVGDWLMWEYRLIKKLRPQFNRAGTKD